jgi:hypothetical protein
VTEEQKFGDAVYQWHCKNCDNQWLALEEGSMCEECLHEGDIQFIKGWVNTDEN